MFRPVEALNQLARCSKSGGYLYFRKIRFTKVSALLSPYLAQTSQQIRFYEVGQLIPPQFSENIVTQFPYAAWFRSKAS